MELLFSVQNQVISRTDDNTVVAKSKNYLTAKFTFSSDWDTVATKTAVFFNEGLNLSVNVELDTNNECDVPDTIIYDPNFLISVYGYTVAGVDLTTVTNCRVCVAKSGYPIPAPIPYPTQDYVKTTNADTGSKKVQLVRELNGQFQYSTDNGTTWITGTAPVESVNRKTGVVVLKAKDIDSEHTPVNYTASEIDIDSNIAGIDTQLGKSITKTAQTLTTEEKTQARTNIGAIGGDSLSNYIAKDNTTEFTPTGDYNPATKKYVLDNIITDHTKLTNIGTLTHAQLETAINNKVDMINLANITLTAADWYTDITTGKQAHKITATEFTSPTTQILDVSAADDTAEEAIKTAVLKSYTTQIDDGGVATLVIYADSSIPADITLKATLTKGVQ